MFEPKYTIFNRFSASTQKACKMLIFWISHLQKHLLNTLCLMTGMLFYVFNVCQHIGPVLLLPLQVGSPSALSDFELNQKLRQASVQHGRTLYVPSGALWGGQDIQRMNDSGTLKVPQIENT